jgi:GT2 family glycosyltransferase
MTTKMSKISVVVASHNAVATIDDCLSALVAQRLDNDAEIVVVDNSTDATAELIRTRFPDIKFIAQPQSALIPQLWAIGIRRSTGGIVALTTAHCIPKKDWLCQILKAHESPVAGVGGAIENDKAARVVDWAIYFCRYSAYMLPLRQQFVSEIAGDNASYKRPHLERLQHVWRSGFWEPAVHAELKKAGFRLLFTPSIVIYHKRSFEFWSFIKQRFWHGIQFGRERASRVSGRKRMLYVLLSPAIPLIFLFRIIRQVISKQRHLGKLVAAFPMLVGFLTAWSFGELIGYLRGPTVEARQLSSVTG